MAWEAQAGALAGFCWASSFPNPHSASSLSTTGQKYPRNTKAFALKPRTFSQDFDNATGNQITE
jgi:hypothetical protein